MLQISNVVLMEEDAIVTAVGTPNMALIKYWGKRDEKLTLPTNSSISITLDETLNTKTSVAFSKSFKEDSLYIDGKRIDLANDDAARERFSAINHLKKAAGTDAKVLVVSKSNFPQSSGLASSASGIATLIFAASAALSLKLDKREMSVIARQGSGSACRSIHGGFVEWRAGTSVDGTDSYAEQIAPPTHWPEVVDMIGILSRERKKFSSRAGMKQTVATSPLYKARMEYVQGALMGMEAAIKAKDFEKLATITMRDSNSMHAVMLDTFPPLMYMNDISKEIVGRVHDLNDEEGRKVCAYTFDAGPNANLITTEKDAGKAASLLKEVDGVEEVLKVRIGNGPRLLGEKDSLISSDLEPMIGE